MKKTKDPATGQFVQGNPGRPKGSVNLRTRSFAQVGTMLVDTHAGQFMEVLERLMASEKVNDQVKGAELYLKALEFVHPKRRREGPPDPWDNMLS